MRTTRPPRERPTSTYGGGIPALPSGVRRVRAMPAAVGNPGAGALQGSLFNSRVAAGGGGTGDGYVPGGLVAPGRGTGRGSAAGAGGAGVFPGVGGPRVGSGGVG